MKVTYEFKTKRAAVEYLQLRGWVIDSQGVSFAQMSNLQCSFGNRILKHGPRNVWMILAS